MSASSDPPLHDLAPTERFSDRAADYVRHRPDYPGPAFDHVIEGLRAPLTAADIGAGTGISSRLLGERGVRVEAIEPNAEMRAAAAPHPLVGWSDGTAEATGLADGAVELVLSAQAFHWFRQPEAIVEFHRILLPGGRLALVWNERDREDPLTLGYIEAIHAVQGEHPAERRPFDPAAVSATGRFEPPVLRTFPHQQWLDRAGLLGRSTSASYVPKEGPRFERLVKLLDELFDRFEQGGRVRLSYRTRVWLARRVGSA